MLIRCKHQQNDPINSFHSTNSRQFIDENQTKHRMLYLPTIISILFAVRFSQQRAMSKLFSQNRSFFRSHLSTIRKPRKQKKNPTQSTNFFHTRNDSWLVTDSNKIISQVQISSLAKKHHRQNSSFLQYSTISALHRTFSLLTVLVLINNIISLQ